MTGTFINVGAILAGTLVGLLLGQKINDKAKVTITSGIGIFTLFLAVSMFLKSDDTVVCLVGLVIGTILGEWMHIEEGLEKLGEKFQKLAEKSLGSGLSGDRQKFIQAFLTATMLFLIGPVGILGSIQDGLTGNYQLLVIKSILDGVASVIFASAMGIGVAFSTIPILVYQGAISLLAEQAQSLMSDVMIAGMTSTGGVLLGAVAISSLIGLKKIRVSSMLPGLFLTPFFIWIVSKF